MGVRDEQRERVVWLLEGHLIDEDLEEPEFTAKWEQLFAALLAGEASRVLAALANGHASILRHRCIP